MAKECVNCGRKVGFINGDHFDGLLCDACFTELGGSLLGSLVNERNPDKYIECYNEIANGVDNKTFSNTDKERIKREFNERIEARFRVVMGHGIQEHYQMIQENLRRQAEEKKKELRRVNYAQSFKEFYEYDVVTIINEDHGTIDKEKMMNILSEHARNGWRLHTIYSNELGKKALGILGLSVNSTACEDVLIFERRIPELD